MLPAGLAGRGDFDKARRTFERVLGEYQRLHARLAELQREALPAAEAADRDALAQAILAGKGEPTKRQAEKLREEIAQTDERLVATTQALASATDGYAQAVLKERERFLTESSGREERARKELAEGLDRVEAALQTLADELGLAAFLRTFPRAKARKPARLGVPGMTGRNGDTYTAAQLVAGLHGLTEPPVERTPPVLREEAAA